MQTDRYDYSPIIHRKPLHWPNKARLALMIAPNIEFFHIDKIIPGASSSLLPDVTGYSHDGGVAQARRSRDRAVEF
jgi:hypothetical protein